MNESLLVPDYEEAHHRECVRACVRAFGGEVKFALSNRGTTAFHGTVTAINWCEELI